MTKPLFELGQIVATPGALEVLQQAGQSPAELLQRHVSGDWGDLDDEDKQANDEALKHCGRIFSSYVVQTGVKVWVISEADRSSSCCLLPSEY